MRQSNREEVFPSAESPPMATTARAVVINTKSQEHHPSVPCQLVQSQEFTPHFWNSHLPFVLSILLPILLTTCVQTAWLHQPPHLWQHWDPYALYSLETGFSEGSSGCPPGIELQGPAANAHRHRSSGLRVPVQRGRNPLNWDTEWETLHAWIHFFFCFLLTVMRATLLGHLSCLILGNLLSNVCMVCWNCSRALPWLHIPFCICFSSGHSSTSVCQIHLDDTSQLSPWLPWLIFLSLIFFCFRMT